MPLLHLSLIHIYHGDQNAEHDGVDAHAQSNGIQDGHEQGQRCDGLHEHGDDEEDQQDHDEDDVGVGGEEMCIRDSS